MVSAGGDVFMGVVNNPRSLCCAGLSLGVEGCKSYKHDGIYIRSYRCLLGVAFF